MAPTPLEGSQPVACSSAVALGVPSKPRVTGLGWVSSTDLFLPLTPSGPGRGRSLGCLCGLLPLVTPGPTLLVDQLGDSSEGCASAKHFVSCEMCASPRKTKKRLVWASEVRVGAMVALRGPSPRSGRPPGFCVSAGFWVGQWRGGTTPPAPCSLLGTRVGVLGRTRGRQTRWPRPLWGSLGSPNLQLPQPGSAPPGCDLMLFLVVS